LLLLRRVLRIYNPNNSTSIGAKTPRKATVLGSQVSLTPVPGVNFTITQQGSCFLLLAARRSVPHGDGAFTCPAGTGLSNRRPRGCWGPKPGAKNSDSSHPPNLPPSFFELFYLHQITFKASQTWLKRVKPTEEPAG
jgi:hypothetical protein